MAGKKVLDAAIAENRETEDCEHSPKSHLKHADNTAERFTLPWLMYLPRANRGNHRFLGVYFLRCKNQNQDAEK